jgi:hypothetical protein
MKIKDFLSAADVAIDLTAGDKGRYLLSPRVFWRLGYLWWY